MTRAEAIACLKKHLPTMYSAHEFIDFCIEVGMLKVEEEKTAREKAVEVLRDKGYNTSACSIVEWFSQAGLEIVEKKK